VATPLPIRDSSMFKVIAILIIFSAAVLCQAQVLTTAETLGKGKEAITVSANQLYDSGVPLNVSYVMYARGLTSSFDLYAAVGWTHIEHQDQAWLGVGENAKLFSAKKFSVSLFTFASVPLHRTDQASTVFLNAAVVVSRPINSKLSVYSGVNTFIPIGARERGLFTPPDKRINVPLGTSIGLGNWTVATEVDVGKLKAVGIAVSKTF